MTIRCVHLEGVNCSLGMQGGRPSLGVCFQCKAYDGPARGAGDIAETIARRTGIKKAVEFVKGGPCLGCEQRRAVMNERFSK